ncbi:MAG: hypothetical protein Q9217_005207 [Psora testacea]
MGSRQGQRPTQLGATFIPGGVDDFYMPEVISPSPQRITPEVPEKIQDNLAHLELEAEPVSRLSGLQSPSPIEQNQGATISLPSRNSSISNITAMSEHFGYNTSDQPTFSPFPPLHNRPANVPPSYEEKESILERARLPVLNSNDPEAQLSWAQDTLTYVEIASQHEARISENQVARSQTPSTEHQLRVDAVSVVSFLADQHHPKAEFLRGMWLEFGKFGFRMDKKEAFRCYQRAAQKGYSRAEYRMGSQFESSNDPEKAVQHYQLGVRGGDSASHYRLGMMTLLGQHGQPLDYEKGVKLVSYAAETADENAPQGAYVFGMLQARELTQVTVPEQYLALDIPGARFNIEKAAYLGFAKAQAKMGMAYELCQLGCDFNPAMSLHYNSLAAKQGDAEADMSISKWFLCGYEGLFEKNEELAFVYAQRAAQTGLATAEFAMGYFYEVGIYVRADLKTSRSWYEKAADHGNKDAAARVDGIARSKTLSRKDHENVAVAKIKSQYGSHKGKRPDRYKATTPMPTISDDAVDMPEPSLPPSRAAQYGQSPYPSNYGNYEPGARPPLAAPYPVDDGRGRHPGPHTRPVNGATYQNYRPRPPPSIHPTSPTEPEGSIPDKNYRGSGFPTFKPQPFPPQNPGRGRGFPPPIAPSVIGPQGYRQPVSGSSSPHAPASPPLKGARPPSDQPPTIDIGFSAPPDLAGADRRRLQKPSENRPLPPGVLPRTSSYDASQVHRNPDRLSSLPHPSTMPNYGRSPSPSRRPISAGRPNIAATPPPSQQIRPDSRAYLPDIPPKIQDPGKPSNTPPPSVPIVKAPGKGPKTFQEMGVPPSKNESDCATDISANLHNKVTKAYAAKALKELQEGQVIAGKASGKQIVYHAIQDPSDTLCFDDLAAMDKEITSLREEVATMKSNEKLLRSNLASMNATMSTTELRTHVQALSTERAEVLARLGPLRKGHVKPVTAKEKDTVDGEWVMWKQKAERRKKIALELWEMGTEALPEGKTKEEVWVSATIGDDERRIEFADAGGGGRKSWA